MGIITAESFYPGGYTTYHNDISDLGATRQPNTISYKPSLTIFNTVMWLAGIIVLMASYYQHKYFKRLLFSIRVLLFGLRLFGVGIFPGNRNPYHGMASMLAFLSGGFCAITSFRIVKPPFKYVCILFGFVS